MPNEDTRLRVAVYGLVRSKRDKLGQGLAVAWAYSEGYRVVEYVDKAMPRQGKDSAWDSLLRDIAKGSFFGVAMWQDSTGMIDYCTQYNTRFTLLDNVFALQHSIYTGRKVRIV